MTDTLENTKSNKTLRILFYFFLGLCFATAAFFNQFGILHDYPIVTKLLAAISFCGTIGMLADYAFRIKHSWFWLIPALTAVEFAGDLVYKAGFFIPASYIYGLSALLWPVYGILFIGRGIELIRSDRGLGIRFIILGILSSAVLGWEVITYYPNDFLVSHWAWRSLYLAIFAWLLVIDYTTDFSKRPEMKVEKQILRVSMIMIAM